MKTNFERIVSWEPAFDKKDYGTQGVTLRFVLKGELGATQFVIFTNWHLRHVQEKMDNKPIEKYPHLLCHPMAADLGYHSYIQQYEGQTPLKNCQYLSGKDCYYDGSSLMAEELYWKFIEEGENIIWKELETFYKNKLEGK